MVEDVLQTNDWESQDSTTFDAETGIVKKVISWGFGFQFDGA